MERWSFERLEVEGCDIVSTQETEEERKQVEKGVEMLGKVLPFLGVELLEDGAREAVAMLQQMETEREGERKEKGEMMREIERELERRGG